MNISDGSEVIPLWSDGAPGTEDWNQKEQERLVPPPISFRTIRNVTQPTLTAFLLHLAVPSGTAVIICPDGAFHSQAMKVVRSVLQNR